MTRYRTIVADPPWLYAADSVAADGTVRAGQIPRSRKTDGSLAVGVRDASYPRMSVQDLMGIQVPSAPNAHLYLWTTNAFIVEAHAIAESWGFAPKTICTWVKTHHGDSTRVSMKTGYYFRGATEHFLFCVRGSLKLQTKDGLPTAYLWPRLPHSVKPDAFYDLVESASPGPYVELFSRRVRFGWDYRYHDGDLAAVPSETTGGES